MTASGAGRLGALLSVWLLLAAGCDRPAASLGGACEPPGATAIVDDAKGFSICLPGHWRDLRPGDPAWVEVYDEPDSDTEQRVASGNIAHFAVPLRPSDVDPVVNLAVYVVDNRRGLTTAEAGDAYVEAGRGADATDPAVSMVSLPGGEFAEVTASIPNTTTDIRSTDWLDAFVLATPATVFYVVFRCGIGSRETYEGQFQQIAATFVVIPGQS